MRKIFNFNRKKSQSQNETDYSSFELSDDEIDRRVAFGNIHSMGEMKKRDLAESRERKKLEQAFWLFIDRANKNSFNLTNFVGQPINTEALFRSRALNILKNKSAQYSFGPALIEYVVIDTLCNSYYSLDNGVNFYHFNEIELRGTYSEYVEKISELIQATESHLKKSITEMIPPMYPTPFRLGYSAYEVLDK